MEFQKFYHDKFVLTNRERFYLLDDRVKNKGASDKNCTSRRIDSLQFRRPLFRAETKHVSREFDTLVSECGI